jgi:nickel/cobalt transporter (NicO) family protein
MISVGWSVSCTRSCQTLGFRSPTGWSKGETARAALQADIGHVISTLIITSVICFAGVAVAAKFGHFIDTAASVALIGFGGWIAISSWRELHRGAGRGHGHESWTRRRA